MRVHARARIRQRVKASMSTCEVCLQGNVSARLWCALVCVPGSMRARVDACVYKTAHIRVKKRGLRTMYSI